MPRLPNISQGKELPDEQIQDVKVPSETKQKIDKPTETSKLEVIPKESTQIETKPDESPAKEEMPSDYIKENCVKINDQIIEIKPTKLRYFRNKAASAYGIIKAVPLHELLTYDKGVLDENRDADQLLYDFLVSAFDDSVFVRDHYDDLDADTIDRIVKIFGRINHIDEKEEAARKNREAQAQAKR
ncbi:MAG: hypothetical protein J6Y78_16210 [Paludibacteraceae bacterium]|nr:hypothetical protein [Paludibacteraceae bacterium]